MLIHGWPGSILEFEKLIGPLTHPKDKNSLAFGIHSTISSERVAYFQSVYCDNAERF